MSFLTVREISERLNISLPMAYRLVGDAGFPTIRVGRVIRVPEDAFRRWVEQQTEARHE